MMDATAPTKPQFNALVAGGVAPTALPVGRLDGIDQLLKPLLRPHPGGVFRLPSQRQAGLQLLLYQFRHLPSQVLASHTAQQVA